MLQNLSYRVKTPLSLSLVILSTALVVSTILILQAYQDSRQSLIDNGLALGNLLTHSLRPTLVHDDVWQAYETLAAAFSPEQDARAAIVVLPDNRVYVSSQPKRFPTYAPLSTTRPEYAVLTTYLKHRSLVPEVQVDAAPNRLFILVPILADDQARLGTLVLSYSRALSLPQFWRIASRVGLATLGILALLLPLGWLWGKRLSTPLGRLADCMGRIGSVPPSRLDCDLTTGEDEIGLLATRFKAMLGELQEKQVLEKQVLASERLAALGRMSAGIAHEINNPLGGMLNAINTYQHHGIPDALTAKTFSLLERGLTQIRETVAALLVEAQLESRALTVQDVEDIYILTLPDAQHKGLDFTWKNNLTEPLPLPSTQVRQILLNLLLNAVTGAPQRGWVRLTVMSGDGRLRISVHNSGASITPERMEHLFEPFHGEGHGLGLWVTYQIVQQLNGCIEARSQPGEDTCFSVTLPLENIA